MRDPSIKVEIKYNPQVTLTIIPTGEYHTLGCKIDESTRNVNITALPSGVQYQYEGGHYYAAKEKLFDEYKTSQKVDIWPGDTNVTQMYIYVRVNNPPEFGEYLEYIPHMVDYAYNSTKVLKNAVIAALRNWLEGNDVSLLATSLSIIDNKYKDYYLIVNDKIPDHLKEKEVKLFHSGYICDIIADSLVDDDYDLVQYGQYISLKGNQPKIKLLGHYPQP